MQPATRSIEFICNRCIHRLQGISGRDATIARRRRGFATSKTWSGSQAMRKVVAEEPENNGDEPDKGAMSRRLANMTDAALESGGRRAAKAISEAGISEDLRKQLEDRIAAAQLPSKESPGPSPSTLLRPPPPSVARTTAKQTQDGKSSSTVALRPDINARDKASGYQTSTMSERERKKSFKEMKAKFEPTGRIPATIQGLTSLANERIEDAIARGQFKNIPRGKAIERDKLADSPFIDTTEYIMNKMIQRQDIVPPWIEKQQEIRSLITKFRSRLRNDWKRHAARTIASHGGSLEEQVARAREYARAEAVENPSTIANKTRSGTEGVLLPVFTQITATGELMTRAPDPQGNGAEAILTNEQPLQEQAPDGTETTSAPPTAESSTPTVPPFRDPSWERIEKSYHELTIQNINNITRSYNLIAPQVAQRPLYSLARELRSMYADVAPQLAAAILDRAAAPPERVRGMGLRDGRDAAGRGARKAMLDDLVGGHERARVYDEDFERKGYGWKQFWRDLWKPGGV